jgi:hypothetical protein
MPKRKRDSDVDTPFKTRASRHLQSLSGAATRGAAAETARESVIDGTDGSAREKQYDTQIRRGTARRKRSNCGRKSEFCDEIEEQIVEAFDEDETQTYREAAETLGMAQSTLHNYINKFMDYRCLIDTARPLPSAANLEALEQSQDISDHDGPNTDEFHQDEKYFINSCRRKRKVRKSDTQRPRKRRHSKSRRHQKGQDGDLQRQEPQGGRGLPGQHNAEQGGLREALEGHRRRDPYQVRVAPPPEGSAESRPAGVPRGAAAPRRTRS